MTPDQKEQWVRLIIGIAFLLTLAGGWAALLTLNSNCG